MVPFVDIITQHLALEKELIDVFRKAIRSGAFVDGPMVKDFERDFAEYCESQHCVGVGSGTDALRFALMAAGVKRDQMVITTPNTFMATTEAISQVGAIPDFVDVDERTYNIDIGKLHEHLELQCDIEDKTGSPVHRRTGKLITAIAPVHLYGQMADMDAIMDLAQKYNLTVVEDACQAHGAEYFSLMSDRWRKAGSMGQAAAFSFYPGKNLGACGEGGAVTTDDERIERKLRMIRNHGQSRKYIHEIEGYNGRLDAIQAGILQIKLKSLTEWNNWRRKCAIHYHKLLGETGEVTVPFEPQWSRAVYHLYVIRTPVRDEVRKHLAENNIATGLHYPVPLHLQKAYLNLGYEEGDFPVSEKIALEMLSLPMYPHLTEDQQTHIVESIKESLKKHSIPVQSPVTQCIDKYQFLN
jgi:dTDP-4-amino-4,6-dideoxygalactose transaminase